MTFWSLLVVAWLPVLQVLLVGLLGALLASSRLDVLTADARRNINKVVYIVFVPSLVFSSLSSTVTLKDIVSWWFMPVNMGIVFLIGVVLGWVSVKAFRPEKHLQGLVIACCSSGNWGNIPLMIVPAICNEEGSPFGDASTCNSLGLSYVSLSMALGNFFIWTHSYSVMKRSATLYKAKRRKKHALTGTSKEHFGQDAGGDYVAFLPSEDLSDEDGSNSVSSPPLPPNDPRASFLSYYLRRAQELLLEILKELCSPPSAAAVVGFSVGATDKVKSLITEEGSPLRVIQDSAKLLGGATIPCTVLILGGNLTKGIGKTVTKPIVVISIIVIRFVLLPTCGIGIVTAATKLGLLPNSPLYRYVLLLQSTVPPAMSIGTIAQLFDVGEEECSIIFLWTHLVAALALTLWSTVFMSLVL
ncbi:protein PIN-LIKES 7-like isoform X2 [Miscanthus floridulus]|uniref:protein PIN-LIKES 7-like isoform X2 n=1 Tax=Miscanthus floridulus TaxID=154761 RepID=UPI003457BEAE